MCGLFFAWSIFHTLNAVRSQNPVFNIASPAHDRHISFGNILMCRC
jgi:hypothetical protein